MSTSEEIEKILNDGLRRVQASLLNGEIDESAFDMTTWSCGTAMCIGGWLEHVLRERKELTDEITSYILSVHRTNKRLEALFYPNDIIYGLGYGLAFDSNTTPKQGADAIEQYLTRPGIHPWTGIVEPDEN